MTPTAVHQSASLRNSDWRPSPGLQASKLPPSLQDWREESSALGIPALTRPSLSQPLTPRLAHSPIYIQGDSDFADQALVEGWLGNGTAANPYIIENLDIDATNPSYCIGICHTTVYFFILHCSLQGPSGWQGTIILDNVSHGCLLNNTCTDSFTGFYISNCTLITAANNTISQNTHSAIHVWDSTLVTLANNTCFANWYSDIELLYSRQNTVINNTCSSPPRNIVLKGSGDNILSGNSMTGGGLYLYGCSPFECRQISVSDNTVNGKPLVLWQDRIGGTVPSGFGQAILVNCSQVTVSDATVTDCYAGLTLRGCTNVTVASLLFMHNQYGLAMSNCSNALVTNNAFLESKSAAISILYSSFYNVVANNTCIGISTGPDARCIELIGSANYLWNNTCMHTPYGIFVAAGSSNTIGGSRIINASIGLFLLPESGGNFVEGNVFTENTLDAMDDSIIGNSFDWNYWSAYHGRDWEGDGIGDRPYLIPGGAYSQDYRPLMLPPGSPVTWLEVPQDQFFLYGTYIYYDLDATATPPGITGWWLSDTTLFAIDAYGVLTNRVTLGAGTYWVQVWVGDWMGNIITAGFNILVGGGTTTTITNMTQIPIIAVVMGAVAVVSTAAFVSIIGSVLLRQRRTTGPPPIEPFADTRPPVDQWKSRCPVCGSALFGDERFCPGCGNRATRARGG